MQFFHKHILAFGPTALLLFLLANSGLAVVVYQCTMPSCAAEDEMSGMACCASQGCSTASPCGDMNPARPMAAHALSVGQPCMTVNVVGGTLAAPTIVEKGFSGQQTFKAYVYPFAVASTATGLNRDLTVSSFAFTPLDVPTSSVETYVLNVTFLI